MLGAAFWKATGERVLVVFALTLASTIGVGAEALDIRAIRWGEALTIAGVAAAGALVKCLLASQVGVKGSPGLVRDPAAVEPAAVDPDPVEPDPEPTNVHRRRAERADLAERLHQPGEHRRDPDLPPPR